MALLRGFNPWVIVFLGMAFFHAWRASLEDFLIFGIAAVLIMTQVFGLTGKGFKQQPQFKVLPIGLVVIAAGLVMFFTERHGVWDMVVLLAFIPIGIMLLLYQDDRVQQVPTLQVLRSRWIWGVWAIGFALAELVAYLGSKIYDDLDTFPTISSLLDPALDNPLGRAVFIVFWLISGVYLFGVRRR